MTASVAKTSAPATTALSAVPIVQLQMRRTGKGDLEPVGIDPAQRLYIADTPINTAGRAGGAPEPDGIPATATDTSPGGAIAANVSSGLTAT